MGEDRSVPGTRLESFLADVEASRGTRSKVRDQAAGRRGIRAEESVDRQRDFLLRLLEVGGQEALQGLSNDLQPVSFMTRGAATRRSVGRVVVDRDTYHTEGTGFLVSPELFLTNQHVLRNAEETRCAVVEFDFEADEQGTLRPVTRRALDPDRLALFSPEEGGLDFALVALGRHLEGPAAIDELGYCPLSNSPDRHVIGMNVNIIQHPGGRPKQVAVRNNLLTYRTATTLLYETDTQEGSSGAPVFNDAWDVVALHHYGRPFAERRDEAGNPLPLTVNEGIRVSAICDELAARAATLPPEQRELLERALALGGQKAPPRGKQLKSPRNSRGGGETSRPAPATASVTTELGAPAMRLVIPIGAAPLEVSIRAGGAAAVAVRVPGGRAPAPPGLLKSLPGAEGKRLDKDYSNRKGFDARFVTGVPVNLRKILEPVASRIAPLADGDQAGLLAYQNFSVVMDRVRRLALLTATNIDGETYLTVDRSSGQVAEEEGETWYRDPRIARERFVAQDFYSAWSHKFDRGHLTRRTDVTWGSAKEAERANADTFHFTNCSPQHFRFNQSSDFWQGIERYVLEHGVLKPGRAKRLSVLQGPVFDDRDPVADWGDDELQIPSAFWKVVIWKGPKGPRAVGLLAEQSELFDEDRGYVPRPDEEEVPQVAQYQRPLAKLAELTGLDLSSLEPHDTFGKPMPGAGEAVRRITKWGDLAI